jgi:multidrug efflux pump
VFVVIIGLIALLFTRIPKSFPPDEDQGILCAQVIAPQGATTERAEKALAEVTHYFLHDERKRSSGYWS